MRLVPPSCPKCLEEEAISLLDQPLLDRLLFIDAPPRWQCCQCGEKFYGCRYVPDSQLE
jgi:hypothetical protein